MGKEYSIQEALKLAIQTEKDSMDFYRKAASVTKNERAKKVFDLLANEEVAHLKSFFDHYKGTEFGDINSFISSPPSRDNRDILLLERAIDADTHEKEALEIAMKEEKEGVERYALLAKGVVDPLVKAIFQKVVTETENHYAMIEDEFMHVMGMVDKSDQDIYVRE